MRKGSLALMLIGASVVAACSPDRRNEHGRINEPQQRAACYSLTTFGDRTGEVVDLDESGRVLVQSATDGAFVWHAGKVTELRPVPPAKGIVVNDMNNAGVVVGDSGSSAVLWRGGAATTIKTEGRRASARAINDLGHVVGGYEDADGRWHAFMFRDGATIELAASGRSVVATGINENDDVIAHEITGPLEGDDATVRGLLFRKGAIIELGVTIGPSSRFQINARGQVLANARRDDGQVHAMLWTDGVLRDLAPEREGSVTGARLNDRGDVVGAADEVLAEFPFRTKVPFVWREGAFIKLEKTGFLAGAPLDLDERGHVVGQLYWRTGSRAALWGETGVATLPDLSGPVALHPQAVATRINESGVITATDWNRAGARQPFVLMPDRCPSQQPDAGSPPDAAPPEPPPEEPTE